MSEKAPDPQGPPVNARGNASTKVPACRTVNIYNTREKPMNKPENLNVSVCDILTISKNKDFADDAEKVIELFKGKKGGRWNTESISKNLLILVNLIDMTYNYTSNEKYHTEHINIENADAAAGTAAAAAAAYLSSPSMRLRFKSLERPYSRPFL